MGSSKVGLGWHLREELFAGSFHSGALPAQGVTQRVGTEVGPNQSTGRIDTCALHIEVGVTRQNHVHTLRYGSNSKFIQAISRALEVSQQEVRSQH